MAANDPLSAAIEFLDSLPERVRDDIYMRVVWLGAADYGQIRQTIALGSDENPTREMFAAQFDPSQIDPAVYTGRALMLRAFINHEIENGISDRLKDEIESALREVEAESGRSGSIDMLRQTSAERREALLACRPDWQRLLDTVLTDAEIRRHGSARFIQRNTASGM